MRVHLIAAPFLRLKPKLLPDFMSQAASCKDRGQIDKDSGKDPQSFGDLAENGLHRRMVGRNIEHIGVGLGPGGCIDRKGGGAAGKKEGKLLSPAGTAPVGQAGDRAEGSDKKQQEMPDKAVERQRPVGIHEARRIRQGKDGAQDAEILKKGRQNGSSLRRLYPREGQAEVHGDAAKLEGKVPPVIVKPI